MKRGAVTQKNSTLVAVWLPNSVIPLLDRAVRREDSDRSKFIRGAIRRKLEVSK